MNVGELIKFLKKQSKDLPVAIRMCSEQLLLEASDIRIAELCEPRPDGWVQDKRPDKPSIKYLLFPGN